MKGRKDEKWRQNEQIKGKVKEFGRTEGGIHKTLPFELLTSAKLAIGQVTELPLYCEVRMKRENLLYRAWIDRNVSVVNTVNVYRKYCHHVLRVNVKL
jgi:hypothetical protein